MPTLREDAGPGLHRVTATDPAARAAEVADALGGRLCRTVAELEVVLEEAAQASRLDDGTAEELAKLARRWTKLSQVSERTRQRVITAAGQRLAPGALAVHPDTVRERARRLDEARAALVDAERALAAHDVDPPDDGPVAEGTPAPAADVEPAPLGAVPSPLRARRNQALGVVLAAFGLALILLALAVVPLWAALLVPFVASLWALRHLRPPEGGDGDGAEEAASLLSEVGAYTDERFGARRAAEEREVERARLDVARSRAEEEVRLAEKAWADLAGPGVDPADVEAVVRRFDPGLDGAEHLVGEAVGVRATEAAVARLAEQWSARWAALELPAPPIAEGEATVRALLARRARAIVLVDEVTVLAEEVTAQVPSVPVVVVEEEADEVS